jgi:hypothetical protein
MLAIRLMGLIRLLVLNSPEIGLSANRHSPKQIRTYHSRQAIPAVIRLCPCLKLSKIDLTTVLRGSFKLIRQT